MGDKLNDKTTNSKSLKPIKSIRVDLNVISIGFSIFAFLITARLVFFSDVEESLREQAIYWFTISLIVAIVPWMAAIVPWLSELIPLLKELKFGDFLDIKLKDVTNKLEDTKQEVTSKLDHIQTEIGKISGTRYANLVYLIDRAGNLAMVQRYQYENRWLPCGTRLDLNETPHEAVYRAITQELGLSAADYDFWPKHHYKRYGNTTIVPKPYQVQSEEHPHAAGEHGELINKHCDFVYVCTTAKLTPELHGPIKARWVSPTEFFREIAIHKQRGQEFTFLDIEKTYQKILIEMKMLSFRE
jgi:8-oxo-dGTP pyrophosphatase MutT (NUDIX family)